MKKLCDLLPSSIELSNSNDTSNQRAILKPLEKNFDLDKYFCGINDPNILRWLLSSSERGISKKNIIDYVEQNIADPASKLYGFFVENQLCGTVRLHGINSEHAHLGIAIFDETLRGKSWGSCIISEVCKTAFTSLKINKVIAGIDVNNIASIKAFTRAGFVQIPYITEQYDKGEAIFLEKHPY